MPMNPDPMSLAMLAKALREGQTQPWDIPQGGPEAPQLQPSAVPPASIAPPPTVAPGADPVALSDELQGMRDNINQHPLVLKLKALLSGTPEPEDPITQRPIQ